MPFVAYSVPFGFAQRLSESLHSHPWRQIRAKDGAPPFVASFAFQGRCAGTGMVRQYGERIAFDVFPGEQVCAQLNPYRGWIAGIGICGAKLPMVEWDEVAGITPRAGSEKSPERLKIDCFWVDLQRIKSVFTNVKTEIRDQRAGNKGARERGRGTKGLGTEDERR